MLRFPLIFVLLLVLAAGCAPSGGQPLPALPAATASPTQPLPTATATPTFDELLTLAQDAANQGDSEGALAFLNAAIAADAGSAQAYLLRGNVHQGRGDWANAVNDYDQAITIDANLAAAYLNRGLAQVQLGNSDQALADVSQAIQISPTFALAYRNRAEMHKSLGNNTAASYDLQVYLSLVPNAPDTAAVQAEIDSLQEQAVAQAGEEGLLFFDDFSDPASGWYTNGDPASPGLYSGGGYVLVENQPGTAVWALPGRIFSDVRVEASATRQAGDDNNFFGLLCRVQGTGQSGNFYAFIISSDGYFGITKKSSDTLALIGQDVMLRHPSINLGDGPNVITGVCSGSRLALYVNGEFVVETTDEEYSSGQVGLISGAFDVPGTSIFFDDFSVRTELP
jgi:tetratricopeptide (TPR) repeat protein